MGRRERRSTENRKQQQQQQLTNNSSNNLAVPGAAWDPSNTGNLIDDLSQGSSSGSS